MKKLIYIFLFFVCSSTWAITLPVPERLSTFPVDHMLERKIFFLERMHIENPCDYPTLFELARSYFDLGNYPVSEKYFMDVLCSCAPSQLRIESDNYVHCINMMNASPTPHQNYYLFLSSGYDSNVNAAVQQSFIEEPNVGVIELNDNQRGKSDYFSNFETGFVWTYPVSDSQTLFANGQAFHRYNYSEHHFDYSDFQLEFGAFKAHCQNGFRIPIRLHQIDKTSREVLFLRDYSVAFEYSRQINLQNLIALNYQLTNVDYYDESKRDATISQFNARWILESACKCVKMNTQFYYAMSNPRFNEGAPLVKNFYGIRMLTLWRRSDCVQPYVGLNLIQNDYKAEFFRFSQTRNDRFLNFAAGVNFKLSRHVILQPSYEGTWNRSNLPIYTYNRYILQLQLQFLLDT